MAEFNFDTIAQLFVNLMNVTDKVKQRAGTVHNSVNHEAPGSWPPDRQVPHLNEVHVRHWHCPPATGIVLHGPAPRPRRSDPAEDAAGPALTTTGTPAERRCPARRVPR